MLYDSNKTWSNYNFTRVESYVNALLTTIISQSFFSAAMAR